MTPKIIYFFYARRSMDESDRQVLSLERQDHDVRAMVHRDGLDLEEAFEESRTAKKPGRPVFNLMLDRIERGEANGLLCWDIDRLYRNPIDEGRVRWLLQRGLIQSIRTPTREYRPEDAGLLMGVEGGRATDYIIRLARNVKSGTEEKLRRGEWPGTKPLGYLYDHRLRNIVPEPKETLIVQTIFEECASRGYTLNAVGNRLAELGVERRSGGPWSNSAVAHFLKNRLYIGLMDWNGEVYEGRYKPLISPELFKKVQDVLKRRGKPRKFKRSHHFPFCGTFRCSCGAMITSQWAKGHGGLYRYCRCSRKNGPCSEKYVQEDAVARQSLGKLLPLAITAEEAAAIRAVMEHERTSDAACLKKEIRASEERLLSLQGKLTRLTHGYLDGLIDEDSYRLAKDKLLVEKTELKQEIARIRRTRTSAWFEPTSEVINALESMGKDGFPTSYAEVAKHIQKIGLNPLISAKTVSFSLASPYDSIPSLLGSARFARGAVAASLDPQKVTSSRWCAVQGSNL